MARSLLDKFKVVNGRILLAIAAAFVILLFVFASGIAQLLTDWWWFQSLSLASVWTTVLQTKILLVAVFGLFTAVMLWVNLFITHKYASDDVPTVAEADLIERYQLYVKPYITWVRVGFAAFMGIVAGLNTMPQWQKYLLFRNSVPFGTTDPVHNKDISFYVFKLPFYSFLANGLFTILLLTLLVTLVSHYFNASIQASPGGSFISKQAKIHLSILLALLALTKSVGYYLDRFEMLTSPSGGWSGVMATDSTIRMPGLGLLMLVALFSAGLLIWNIWRKGWELALVALGVWALSHIVILGVATGLYQRLRVVPVTTTAEAPYVEKNIAATRAAFNLDSVERRSVGVEAGLQQDNVDEYKSVIENVPLVDPDRAVVEFNNNQGKRDFYNFAAPLDVDRYQLGGKERPVAVSVRSLKLGAARESWEDQHVAFTHGYAAVIAASYDQGRFVTKDGKPDVDHSLDYKVSGLGDQLAYDDELAQPTLKFPQVYYDDGFGGYAVVGATRDEIDYQGTDNKTVPTRYQGSGGVSMGSRLRRAAFAIRFQEIDPLISSSVTSESKVIFNRDIMVRARNVAPFLTYDSDPYPVVADDRIYWMIDAYTSTSDYPYSEPSRINNALAGKNYARNSVKVVVDAYDGDIKLYVIDKDDPIAAAWSKAFPALFADAQEMPEQLQDHLKYPKDLFNVQTEMWSRYVIDSPESFIQDDISWSVASEPGNTSLGDEEDDENKPAIPMAAQYVFNRLPASGELPESDDQYLLQRFFVPKKDSASQREADKPLAAAMMASSSFEDYGKLTQINFTGAVQAPSVADTEMRKNEALTDFDKQKLNNKVDFGEMNLLFVGNNLVYIRSIYSETKGTSNIPELERVIAVTGDNRQAFGRTIDEAITNLLGESSASESTEPAEKPVAEPGDGTPTTPVEEKPAVIELPEGVDELEKPSSVTNGLDQINALLDEADAAEAAGDREKAATLRQQASEVLSNVRELLGG